MNEDEKQNLSPERRERLININGTVNRLQEDHVIWWVLLVGLAILHVAFDMKVENFWHGVGALSLVVWAWASGFKEGMIVARDARDVSEEQKKELRP